MIVQGFFADFAAHSRCSVLSPENNDLAVKNISLRWLRKFQCTPGGDFFTGVNVTLHPAGITKSLECLAHNCFKRCDLGVRQFFEFARPPPLGQLPFVLPYEHQKIFSQPVRHFDRAMFARGGVSFEGSVPGRQRHARRSCAGIAMSETR